jgi:hypothetical protein
MCLTGSTHVHAEALFYLPLPATQAPLTPSPLAQRAAAAGAHLRPHGFVLYTWMPVGWLLLASLDSATSAMPCCANVSMAHTYCEGWGNLGGLGGRAPAAGGGGGRA